MHYKWQGLVAREKRTATAATTKNRPFKKRSGTLCNEDAISISHFTVMFARYINNNTQTQRRMQLGRGKKGVKQNITKAVHVQPQGKKILAAIKKRERESACGRIPRVQKGGNRPILNGSFSYDPAKWSAVAHILFLPPYVAPLTNDQCKRNQASRSSHLLTIFAYTHKHFLRLAHTTPNILFSKPQWNAYVGRIHFS